MLMIIIQLIKPKLPACTVIPKLWNLNPQFHSIRHIEQVHKIVVWQLEEHSVPCHKKSGKTKTVQLPVVSIPFFFNVVI